MKQGEIEQILLSKGYTEKQSSQLSKDLSGLAQPLAECFSLWALNGKAVDFSSHGLSVLGLMKKFGLKYPAALLSMDWVVKDPDKAIAAIQRGVR